MWLEKRLYNGVQDTAHFKVKIGEEANEGDREKDSEKQENSRE